MTDARSGAEEELNAALKDALLAVNRKIHNVLSELKKPWSETSRLCSRGRRPVAPTQGEDLRRVRDVFVKELPRVAPPKLLVLFRRTNVATGLVQATLDADRRRPKSQRQL